MVLGNWGGGGGVWWGVIIGGGGVLMWGGGFTLDNLMATYSACFVAPDVTCS